MGPGAYTPQSRASMHVARMLDPQPGERVLDLCAAPGGKTTHVAALMGGTGEVVAVERHAGRARALAATCARQQATSVQVVVADAGGPLPDGPFDRVLLDPPCSGLGTVNRHPDLRWRMSPGGVERLAAAQKRYLAAAVGAVRPGGVVVYATCTLSERENERVVAAGALPETARRVLLPHRDGTDGFFISRLGG